MTTYIRNLREKATVTFSDSVKPAAPKGTDTPPEKPGPPESP